MADIQHMHAMKFRRGSLSLREVLRLNWLRFVFLASSVEIAAVALFAIAFYAQSFYMYNVTGMTEQQFWLRRLNATTMGYFALAVSFLGLFTPYEYSLSPERQKSLYLPMLAFVSVFSGLGITTETYLLRHHFQSSEFQFIEIFLAWVVTIAILHTVLALRFGTSYLFFHYYRAVAAPAIFDELDAPRCGRLMLLYARQNYVEVVTTEGSFEVRMTMGEAIERTAPLGGKRVHRSVWVAEDFLEPPFKEGRRWFMNVAGIKVSVSPEYARRVTEEGR